METRKKPARKKTKKSKQKVSRSHAGRSRDRHRAKFRYQVDGLRFTEIAEEFGRSVHTIRKWSRLDEWKNDKSIVEKLHETELKSRLKRAEEIGIGIENQMQAARKMMNPDKDELLVGKDKYDVMYKGALLAMKLTGTEIKSDKDQKDGDTYNIINYHLPHKQPLYPVLNNEQN